MPETGVHCPTVSPRAILTGLLSGIMFGASSNPRRPLVLIHHPGSSCYSRGAFGPLSKFLVQDLKASLIDEHLGSFLSCVFLWDAFSIGPMGQMKQAQESVGGFSCRCSHASIYISEESLFQLEISILTLRKWRVNRLVLSASV